MFRTRFYRRVQVMSKAHVPFADAIREMRDRAFIARNGVLYAALRSIAYRLERGRSIEESLDGWLPHEERMLLAAGDRLGYAGFAAAIDQIMTMNAATKGMTMTIVTGLIEPVLMITAMYLLIDWLSGNFNKKAIAITHISPDRLTGGAYQMYAVGVFAATIWAWVLPLLVLVAVAAVLASMPYLTRPKKLRTVLDHLPPYNIYKSITAARWLLTFSTMGMAGLPYELVFRETTALARPWLRQRLVAIETLYRRGIGLGPSFLQSGYDFPNKTLIEDLIAFGDRPGLENPLMILAEEMIKTTTRTVKTIAFMMTAVGYLIVFGGMMWIMNGFDAFQSQINLIIQQSH
ncbi:MAG: type II secretion system F family protein [Acidiphilium sp.]|nr:type II secretion system F family protein [Acidiphilium sp.]